MIEEKEVSTNFELVLLDKDKNGHPNGKKSSIKADSGEDIYKFYEKHTLMMEAKQGKKRRNKKNNKAKRKND